MTAQELALESMTDLGVTRVGEVPSPGILADLLIRLNQFVSSVSIEPLLSFLQKHTVETLQSGVSRYTVGVAGAFPTVARPMKLTATMPTGILSPNEELQAASQATLGETSALPRVVGADTASPLMNLGVHPIPNAAASLELTYTIAITPFASLSTTLASVGFPDGWEEFLHFNFALALLPRYGRQGFSPDALIKNAQLAKEKIAALNQPTPQQAAA